MHDRLKQLLIMYEKNPTDSFLNFALAIEFIKINNSAKALMHFQNILINDENYVGTYYHLGKLYEELGQKENAKETYLKGISIANKLNEVRALSELQEACKLLETD